MRLQFEWDKTKALNNIKKHHISFEEACTIFADPNALTIVDSSHSDNELREITIGLSKKITLAVVCHTDRNGRIRIISARKATKNEKFQYMENSK